MGFRVGVGGRRGVGGGWEEQLTHLLRPPDPPPHPPNQPDHTPPPSLPAYDAVQTPHAHPLSLKGHNLNQHGHRGLHVRLELGEPLRAYGAINDSVVAAEGGRHDRRRLPLTRAMWITVDHHTVLYASHRQNARLRGNNNRLAGAHTIRTHVHDGKCSGLVAITREGLRLRTLGRSGNGLGQNGEVVRWDGVSGWWWGAQRGGAQKPRVEVCTREDGRRRDESAERGHRSDAPSEKKEKKEGDTKTWTPARGGRRENTSSDRGNESLKHSPVTNREVLCCSHPSPRA